MIRYFKCGSDNDNFEIWIYDTKTKLEKCAFDTSTTYDEYFDNWHKPDDRDTVIDYISRYPDNWKEITEEEAFLESV